MVLAMNETDSSGFMGFGLGLSIPTASSSVFFVSGSLDGEESSKLVSVAALESRNN